MDKGELYGLAWALGQANAQNQANAEYNSIRQGYMAQGFTAEQATALANDYFAPINYANAIAYHKEKAYGWTAWCWYGLAAFFAVAALHGLGGLAHTSPGDSDYNGGAGAVLGGTFMLLLGAAVFAFVPCRHRLIYGRLLADAPDSSKETIVCHRCGSLQTDNAQANQAAGHAHCEQRHPAHSHEITGDRSQLALGPANARGTDSD